VRGPLDDWGSPATVLVPLERAVKATDERTQIPLLSGQGTSGVRIGSNRAFAVSALSRRKRDGSSSQRFKRWFPSEEIGAESRPPKRGQKNSEKRLRRNKRCAFFAARQTPRASNLTAKGGEQASAGPQHGNPIRISATHRNGETVKKDFRKYLRRKRR